MRECVIGFDDPANNDWLAVNQFTVVENKHKRRPNMLPFVNSLPLGVIELKNPADLNFVNPLISRYIGNDSSSILSPVSIVAMGAHFRRSVGAT